MNDCAGCGGPLDVKTFQICASCQLEYCPRCIDDGNSSFCKDCAAEAREEEEAML